MCGKVFQNHPLYFSGCILCELLTGYPLLPGEDEGKTQKDNIQIYLKIQIQSLFPYPHPPNFFRRPAVVHHRTVRNAPSKTSRPVKASKEFYLLKRYKYHSQQKNITIAPIRYANFVHEK